MARRGGGSRNTRRFTCWARCTRHSQVKLRARGAQLSIAVSCAVSALSWTDQAAAYCRTMSCELGEDPTHPCPRDANQCVTQGHALHWASPCLTYSVQVDGSPRSKLDADQVQGFVEQAFSVWKAAQCPGGVTTPTGGTESGLVIDTDIEINSQDYSFESDPSGMMSPSLLYVLTHELGHFLGLAHSSASSSVMSTGYQSLPFSPNLISTDDAAAICAVFPPGPKLSCGSPPASTYDACEIPLGEHPPCKLSSLTQDASSCGCHLAASSRRRPLPTLAALGLTLAALATRRRKRKRSR